MRRLPILLSCLFVGALLMPGCGDEEAPADTYRGPSGGYGTTTGYGDGSGQAPATTGSMGTGYSDEEPEEPDGPIPVAADADLPLVRRLLAIDGNAATRLIDKGPLTVEAYSPVQITDTGLPREGSAPSFRWTADAGTRTWPLEEVVAVPADGSSWLVAYMDLNGTGRLDTGDRVGLPSEPLAVGASDVPAERLELRVDRIFVSLEPAGGYGGAGDDDDGREGPPDGGPGGGPDAPDGEPDEDENPPRPVTLEASSEDVAKQSLGGLILMGFEGKDVAENGLPKAGARGVWSFTRARGALRWPVVVQVRVPQHGDLWVVPVLDVDGDNLLGPGDWLGVPNARFNPPGDRREPIMFGIDRSFESAEYEADVTFAADAPPPPRPLEMGGPRPGGPDEAGTPNEPPAKGCGS